MFLGNILIGLLVKSIFHKFLRVKMITLTGEYNDRKQKPMRSIYLSKILILYFVLYMK
jgi:hypothetical protein